MTKFSISRLLSAATIAIILALFAACIPGAAPTPEVHEETEGEDTHEEGDITPQVFVDVLTEMDLSGRLVFIQAAEAGSSLMALDLTTGEQAALFTPPQDAYLAYADASPDGSQIAIAYAPQPEEGQPQMALTSLLLLPASSSGEPAPLLQTQQPGESYSYPAWSPDGQWIYFTHTLPGEDGAQQVRIERVSPAGEAPEVIVSNAMWPGLSPDGQRLAYLSVDPETNVNELFLAAASGADAAPALPPGRFPTVDAHAFSPDGRFLYFSAVNEAVQAGSEDHAGGPWRLLSPFAARPVSAHDAASDFYRIELETGEISQVTYLNATNLNIAFSPDGTRAAVIADRGIFITNLTGSEVKQIAELPGAGAIDWVQ